MKNLAPLPTVWFHLETEVSANALIDEKFEPRNESQALMTCDHENLISDHSKHNLNQLNATNKSVAVLFQMR